MTDTHTAPAISGPCGWVRVHSPAVLLLVVAAQSTEGQVMQTTIAGGPACGTCRIDRTLVTAVGDTAGPAMLGAQTLIMGGHGDSFYLFTSATPGQLVQIGFDGTLGGTHGRTGRGPGEYTRPTHTIPRRDGMVQVVDAIQRRWTLVDQSQTVHGVGNLEFYFSRYVQLDDGTVVANGILRTRDAVGYPLHILNDSLRAVRTFGTDAPVYDPRRPYLQSRSLANAGAGEFWTAPMNRLELEKWNASGTLVARVSRSTEWFEPWDDFGTLMQIEPPKSKVEWIYQDSDGRVWVAVHVADANYKAEENPGHVMAVDADNNRFYDTIVEVWDIAGGRVLTSTRYDKYMFGFRNGQGFVFTAREDEIGNPFYDIWRLHLTER